MSRVVTERDFRRPEFYDADPKDYEFRADGAIVRKDRWEMGIRNIWNIVNGGLTPRSDFEIKDVVESVRSVCNRIQLQENDVRQIQDLQDFLEYVYKRYESCLDRWSFQTNVWLKDGSFLKNAYFNGYKDMSISMAWGGCWSTTDIQEITNKVSKVEIVVEETAA